MNLIDKLYFLGSKLCIYDVHMIILPIFFLPFCSQMKGETLHTLIYKQHHKFSFQSLTKITNQIAQVNIINNLFGGGGDCFFFCVNNACVAM